MRTLLDCDLKEYEPEMKRGIWQAYLKDVGRGDATGNTVLSPMKIKARIIAEENGIAAGILEARFLLEKLGIRVRPRVKDGGRVRKGETVLEMQGSARKILCAERTALNFLTRESGIATETRRLSKAAGVRVAATRKTCLQHSDKRAVMLGGGAAHRVGLDRMILIKDNHIDIVRLERGCSRIEAIRECLLRAKRGGRIIEIEVKSLSEAKAALAQKPDIMMADGTKPAVVKRISGLLRKTGILLEASGRITEKNAAKYGKAGAAVISSGSLTHSCRALDMSLEVVG